MPLRIQWDGDGGVWRTIDDVGWRRDGRRKERWVDERRRDKQRENVNQTKSAIAGRINRWRRANFYSFHSFLPFWTVISIQFLLFWLSPSRRSMTAISKATVTVKNSSVALNKSGSSWVCHQPQKYKQTPKPRDSMTAVREIEIAKWNSKLSSTVLPVLVLRLSQNQDCVSMGWDSTAWAGKWTSVVRVGRREDRRSHLLQTINQLNPYPMPGHTLDL